tara:strand:- start:157 stop:975 length:819 start_codon:yes stop_codon:yes gene_type:complete
MEDENTNNDYDSSEQSSSTYAATSYDNSDSDARRRDEAAARRGLRRRLGFTTSDSESSVSGIQNDESSSSDDDSDVPIWGDLAPPSPRRIHALDSDSDTEGAAGGPYPNERSIDEVFIIGREFNNRRVQWQQSGQAAAAAVANGPSNARSQWFYKNKVLLNANRIISRWESERELFDPTSPPSTRAIAYKAFSNYHDIIEDLIDENLALKSVINARQSNLETETLASEAKKESSRMNQLPEEIEKRVRTFLGGRKTRRIMRRRPRRQKYLFS